MPAPDERQVLVQWLDWQRATVVAKCAGLDEARAGLPLLPTSPDVTVRGVVSHLTDVERQWMTRSFLGRAVPPASSAGGWQPPVDRTLGSLVEEYREQCEESRRIADEHDLDELEQWAPDGQPLVTLR